MAQGTTKSALVFFLAEVGVGALWVGEVIPKQIAVLLALCVGFLMVVLVWSDIVRLSRRLRGLQIQSPLFLPPRTQQSPAATAQDETERIGDWLFRKMGADGGRALVQRNGSSYRIVEADAYEYFMKLNDAERRRIVEKWGRFRSVYWLKHKTTRELPGIYDFVPVYFDPEGLAWRKGEIAGQPDAAKARLKKDRPDVWGFYLDEPEEEYMKKYPGKLPYERRGSP